MRKRHQVLMIFLCFAILSISGYLYLHGVVWKHHRMVQQDLFCHMSCFHDGSLVLAMVEASLVLKLINAASQGLTYVLDLCMGCVGV